MKITKLTLLAAGFMLATGCSSIVSQSDYAVAIASTPDAANFVVTNKAGQKVQSGVTPTTINLKSSAGYFKGEAYTIEFSKDGYTGKAFTLNSGIDGWYFGNILFGGLIGMLIVDPATGAMYSLPKRVDIAIDPQESEESVETLSVTTIDSLTDEQRARLVALN